MANADAHINHQKILYYRVKQLPEAERNQQLNSPQVSKINLQNYGQQQQNIQH
jgi:hypothetical protein